MQAVTLFSPWLSCLRLSPGLAHRDASGAVGSMSALLAHRFGSLLECRALPGENAIQSMLHLQMVQAKHMDPS
jgi:hypothetical protein